jgi:hypothetical protein
MEKRESYLHLPMLNDMGAFPSPRSAGMELNRIANVEGNVTQQQVDAVVNAIA